MSDARALLRAKRQEARITHPYASYSSSGQLRCSVCATAVKQASMWEGHIGSKAHRVAVSKLREKEMLAEEERRAAEKRKLEEESNASSNKKRRVSEEPDDEDDEDSSPPSKSTQKSAKGGFPADFFSDPSRAIPLSTEDDEEDAEEATGPPATETAPKSKTDLDLEWEAFQAAMQQTPAEEEKEEEKRDAYNRATVFAEPELVSTANEGLPQAAPEPEVTETEQKEETEEEKRKRKEQEERELIMDRLIEEEREQEEADMRVERLKAKLEAAKKARSERKKKS